jgi:hypothetical protein
MVFPDVFANSSTLELLQLLAATPALVQQPRFCQRGPSFVVIALLFVPPWFDEQAHKVAAKTRIPNEK